jgi:hypothetical protein
MRCRWWDGHKGEERLDELASVFGACELGEAEALGETCREQSPREGRQ